MQLCSSRVTVVCAHQPVVCAAHHGAPRHALRHWPRPASKSSSKETPISRYLRSTLALRDQVVDGTLALCPSLTQFGPQEVDQLVGQNLSLLGSLAPPAAVRSAVLANPCLLAVPLNAWYDFFVEGFGLQASQFWRLLCSSPAVMLQGSVFRAGSAIMFLQALGWSELEMTTIIIPYHAAILQRDVESQLQPVLAHLLHARGLSYKAAQEFLHHHPDVLYSDDFEARIKLLLRKQRMLQSQCI